MKTIKPYLLAIVSLSFGYTSNGQSLHIRPELGVNFAKERIESNAQWARKEYSTQFKPGIRAGVNVKIFVKNGLFVEPGFFYSMKGFKKNNMVVGTSTLPVIFTKCDLTYSTDYLEIPVNLGYDLELAKGGNIAIAVGPYMGFLLSGKMKAEFDDGRFEDLSRSAKIGSKKEDDYKLLDFGLNVSLGYQAPRGVYFRTQGGLGAANIVSNEDVANMKSFVLSLSVGYDLPVGGRKN
jgi:hypothetical protein